MAGSQVEVPLYFHSLRNDSVVLPQPAKLLRSYFSNPSSNSQSVSPDRATLMLQYQRLDSTASELVQQLGLLVGESFTASLATALLESDAKPAIDQLVSFKFIDVISLDRYQWTHDQVRSFARQRLGSEQTIAQRQTARMRICRWYREQIESISPTATDWFEPERQNLFAAIEWAEQSQSWETLMRLITAIAEFLDHCGDALLGKQLSELGLKASKQDNNPFTAALLNNLGNFNLRQQQWQSAESQYQQSLQISSRSENSIQAAQTLVNLGVLALQQEKSIAAAMHWKKAIAQLPSDVPEQIALQQRMFSISPDLLQAAGGTICSEPSSARFFQRIKRFILE